MSSLKLWLLGPPRLEVDGSPVEIPRHKAVALLIYLAVTSQEQHRDTLATLFWPDSPQSRARASLRRDLSILKKALDGDWLAVEQETIDLRRAGFWLDLAQFRLRLAECHNHGHAGDAVCSACLQPLTEAVDLYRDDFLTGFSLPDCPAFDEWQFFEAEKLRQELSSALKRLVLGYSTQGAYESALPYARHWVSLDPVHEPAHRQLMHLYAQTDQQAAAIRQYQLCVQTLNDELGVTPSAETAALYERIRSGESNGDAVEQPGRDISGFSTLRPNTRTPLPNLPAQPTPFVGRLEELTEIAKRLGDPACRLLTLVGPGGIGKTRLAIQAAQNIMGDAANQLNFSNGVYYVPLVSVGSSDHLIPAMADALNFTFYRDVKPKEQLLNYLHEKEMLLVLDNFEHLLSSSQGEESGEASAAEGTELLTDILAIAPRVKLLVTSREALNLQEEWVYPVEGMRYPTVEVFKANNMPTGLESYSAVQLFLQHAARLRPDFSLAAEQACVLQICRLVEGMPLAIELAAAWLKVLPCANIAREIERSLDFLTTSWRNVPPRHRSMRAVFEHSWQLMSGAECGVLGRLSVFRGGFGQSAAENVAGASLLDLAALVEKSLLRATPAGRYHMHELLRQFSAEKLAESPQDEEETRNRHCDYFVTFLQQREEALKGKQQKAALDEIRPELENVRMAWNRVVLRGNIKAIDQSLNSLYDFFWISSRFQEGAETFRQAAEQLPGSDAAENVLVKLVARQGAFWASLGVYGLARELLQKSLSMARRLNMLAEIAFSLNFLGDVLNVQGEFVEAEQLYEESLAISRQRNDRLGMAYSLERLGWLTDDSLGKFVEAERYYQECLTLYRAVEYQVGIAHSLDKWAKVAWELGEYTRAEQYYQESLAIFREIGDRLGIAKALGGLALVRWGQGGPELTQAKVLIEESLAVCRETGHRHEIAVHLAILGYVANSLAEYEQAQRHLQEGLAIFQELKTLPDLIYALSGLGEAAIGRGEFQTAKEYLHEAIERAINGQDTPRTLQALVPVASLLVKEAHFTTVDDTPGHRNPQKIELRHQALRILIMVLNHPATWQVIKDKAARLLAELEAELPPEIVAAARAKGQAKALDEIVIEILTEQ